MFVRNRSPFAASCVRLAQPTVGSRLSLAPSLKTLVFSHCRRALTVHVFCPPGWEGSSAHLHTTIATAAAAGHPLASPLGIPATLACLQGFPTLAFMHADAAGNIKMAAEFPGSSRTAKEFVPWALKQASCFQCSQTVLCPCMCLRSLAVACVRRDCVTAPSDDPFASSAR